MFRSQCRFCCSGLASFGLLVAISGCGETSDAPPTANLKLSVTVDGAPAPEGLRLKASPQGKGMPQIYTTSGTGVIEGPAVIGDNVVTVISAPSPSGAHGDLKGAGIGAVFGTDNSPLRITVTKDGTTPDTIEIGLKADTSSGGGKPRSHKAPR